MHPFDADVSADRIDRGWYAAGGANGGFLAAMVLRAMRDQLADPSRRPVSRTMHYVSRAEEGPVGIDVAVERAGRSLTTLSARLSQGDRLTALAVAAFSRPRDGIDFDQFERPAAPPWDEVEPVDRQSGPPIWQRLEARPVWGGPPFGTDETATAGGWLQLRPPRAVDELLVALFCDAWFPSLFALVEGPSAVPTIDMTFHFRNIPDGSDAPCLVRFRSRLGAGGYLEEDGEVWSHDGRLLAHSRQLALALPIAPA